MAKTKIQWADVVWNPITGCSPCSEGCKNCYAVSMQQRLKRMEATKHKYRTFKPTFHTQDIKQPYHWKKPLRVFTVSMGDIFHEDVPFIWIDMVMMVIRDNPQHIFILLTKRPAVAREYFQSRDFSGVSLKNVYLGVSVENQLSADERIPILLDIKAPVALKMVSAEPLIAPVDLKPYIKHLGWVIVGGETGKKARPMLRPWAEHIERQCSKAKVPFFFKSWGAYVDMNELDTSLRMERRKFTTTTTEYEGNTFYLKKIGPIMAGSKLYGGGANTKQFP